MTRAIRAIAFDLDGTLIDSCSDIAAAANFALQAHDLPARAETEIAGFVGDGAANLILRASNLAPNSSLLPKLLETFLANYAQHATERTTLMPGALEALRALEHLPLAVVTNKPRQPALAVLAHLGILSRFRAIVAGGDLPQLKPDPMALVHAATELGVPVASLAIVGDGPQDVECGRRAQAVTIGVRGGIADEARLLAENPDHLLDSLFELPPLIERLSSEHDAKLAPLA